MIMNLQIPVALSGCRLDDALAGQAAISKGEARRIIDRGGCAVNQSMVRVASRAVKAGDLLTVGVMQPGEFRELVLGPEAIVYQDRDILAVSKPSGIASQRTPYQLKGTLEYWVGEEFARQGVSEPVRVVHRLDRGTSGLMLFPKHRQAAAYLSELFKLARIQKRYLALVTGVPQAEQWSADGPIGKVAPSRYGVMDGGRQARTLFRSLGTHGDRTLVEAQPLTGRTHQIRVHLAAAGLPIVGDQSYGGATASRLMLHCVGLSFDRMDGHPLTLAAVPGQDFCQPCGDCWPSALVL